MSILNREIPIELAAQCLGCTVDMLRACLAMEDFTPVAGKTTMEIAMRCFERYAPPRGADDDSRMQRMRLEK